MLPIHRAIKLALIIFFLLPVAVKAQDASRGASAQIVFMENAWPEALKLAAQQNKYIFVDAYAVWCGPCKKLKRTTFKDKTTAAFFNSNFINVAIDMEKGIGPSLAQQWRLQAYPTLLVFNPQGKLVTYVVGFVKAPELLKFGKHALGVKEK